MLSLLLEWIMWMSAYLLTWMTTLTSIVVGGWVVYWIFLRPLPVPKKTTHPYSRPSIFYPLKVIAFYCMVKLRKRNSGSADGAGYGAKSYHAIELLERPQVLHPNPKAIDAVFFSGAADGAGVIVAMERRPNRLSSTLIYIRLPQIGLLVSPSHPDTITFRKSEDEGNFASGGITILPQRPMASWRILYSGKLRLHKETSGDLLEAKLELEWSSNLPHFDYDSDMDIFTMAKAFGAEPWSKEYFECLKEHHQTHYEQMGRLHGTVTLNDQSYPLDLPAFRDHSYGKRRDWRLMHRYVFHHIFLKDGSKGVVGVVCQPSTCSRLVLGNWCTRSGTCLPVTSVDLSLQEHGEGGTPPTDYAFQFSAGGVEMLVMVEVEESPQHYLGWDWEARMVETWVKYRVNGVPGSGICEWNYRHHSGRPLEFNAADPEWASEYRPQYLAA